MILNWLIHADKSVSKYSLSHETQAKHADCNDKRSIFTYLLCAQIEAQVCLIAQGNHSCIFLFIDFSQICLIEKNLQKIFQSMQQQQVRIAEWFVGLSTSELGRSLLDKQPTRNAIFWQLSFLQKLNLSNCTLNTVWTSTYKSIACNRTMMVWCYSQADSGTTRCGVIFFFSYILVLMATRDVR